MKFWCFERKCDFNFWWKIWFYGFGEKYNFKVLAGKDNFSVLERKWFCLFSKDFAGLKKNMILRENDFVVLSEKMILRFGRKMWFYCFKGKWAFCEFYGFGGKNVFMVLTEKYDFVDLLEINVILQFWQKIWFFGFDEKYAFVNFVQKM